MSSFVRLLLILPIDTRSLVHIIGPAIVYFSFASHEGYKARKKSENTTTIATNTEAMRLGDNELRSRDGKYNIKGRTSLHHLQNLIIKAIKIKE